MANILRVTSVSVSTLHLVMRLVFVLRRDGSELLIPTMGARHYPGSHGGEPSTLPLSYPAIPIRVKDAVRS